MKMHAMLSLSRSNFVVGLFYTIFLWEKSIAETVQGCVETTLQLQCSDMMMINISSVVLGDSNCLGSYCCIISSDCTASPNDSHVHSVQSICNGQRHCSVPVIKAKIQCGYFSAWSDNDFERITYSCVDVEKEMAEGCVETTLQLECSDMKIINISSVVLGESKCRGSNCCIKPNDCTKSPNDGHLNSVHSRCNGKRNCSVPVFKEEIYCAGFWDWDGKRENDFERITYYCVDAEQSTTTNPITGDQNTISGSTTEISPTYAIYLLVLVILVFAAIVITCVTLWAKRKRIKLSGVNSSSGFLFRSQSELVESPQTAGTDVRSNHVWEPNPMYGTRIGYREQEYEEVVDFQINCAPEILCEQTLQLRWDECQHDKTCDDEVTVVENSEYGSGKMQIRVGDDHCTGTSGNTNSRKKIKEDRAMMKVKDGGEGPVYHELEVVQNGSFL